MKKSIKYAGIAAATLLTVAPIAAPVVSQAAADTSATANLTPDANALASAVSTYKGQFSDIETSAVKDGDAFVLSNAINSDNNKMSYGDFATKEVPALMADDSKYSMPDLLTKDTSDNDANVRDFYVTATANGTEINNKTDLLTYLADSSYKVAYTIHFTYTDTDQAVKNDTIVVNVKSADNGVSLTSVNAKFSTPLNVALNSTTTDTQLIGKGTVRMTDQNGKGLIVTSAQPKATYYNTYAGAMENDGNTALATDAVNGGKFVKGGTYYQPITVSYTADSPLGNFVNTKYNVNPSANPIMVNGVVATPGYDFKLDNTNSTFTFVRKVVVSNSTSQWTTAKVTGTVTTKGDSSYYTLKNNDNVTIKNRALSANSGWKTNAVRTDQNGNKQYRVATGEWVDANDVTFNDGNDSSTGTETGALTDVTKVKGIVSVGTPGFTYLLYAKDGSQIKNRALAGGSDWQVSATAKDADGNTYYKVATNEWVMAGNGVTFAVK